LIEDFFESVAPRSSQKMDEISEEIKQKLKKTLKFLGKDELNKVVDDFSKDKTEEIFVEQKKEKKDLESTFNEIDTNKSGKIEFNEFKTYFLTQIKHMEDEFKNIDKESRNKLKSFISNFMKLRGSYFDETEFDESSCSDEEEFLESPEIYNYHK
jgi:lipopolysaccharide export LptBFGC system permease protein LptF